MVTEQRMGKDVEGSGRGFTCGAIPIFLGSPKIDDWTLPENNGYPGPISKQERPGYRVSQIKIMRSAISHSFYKLESTEKGEFDPTAIYVGPVVDKLTLGQVSNGYEIFYTKFHQNRSKYWNYSTKWFTALDKVRLAQPIFTKLTFAQQLTAKNSYAQFHRNPTNCVVADTRSQEYGQKQSPHISGSFCTWQRRPNN